MMIQMSSFHQEIILIMKYCERYQQRFLARVAKNIEDPNGKTTFYHHVHHILSKIILSGKSHNFKALTCQEKYI